MTSCTMNTELHPFGTSTSASPDGAGWLGPICVRATVLTVMVALLCVVTTPVRDHLLHQSRPQDVLVKPSSITTRIRSTPMAEVLRQPSQPSLATLRRASSSVLAAERAGPATSISATTGSIDRHSVAWAMLPLLGLMTVGGLAVATRTTPDETEAAPKAAETGQKKRVVVVGGGFGGLGVLRELSNSPGVDVTIIEPKDYFEFTPGIPRALVDPSMMGELQVPMTEAIPEGVSWIQGKAVGVDLNRNGPGGQVWVRRTGAVSAAEPTHAMVSFDELVVCTGANYAAPIRPSLETETQLVQRQANLARFHDRLAAARCIVIIGGGVVGVELAAEIVENFPEIQLHIINRTGALLSGVPKNAGIAATEWLTRRGAILHLGTVVTEQTPQLCGSTLVELQSGQWIAADIVFDCTRSPPNSHIIRTVNPPLSQDVLDPRGAVRVDSQLKVMESVLALGDVVVRKDVPKPDGQSVMTADLGARVLSERLAGSEEESDEEDPTLPATLPRLTALSLGKAYGVLVVDQHALSGPVFGRLAAVAKLLIRITKVLEARRQPVGIRLWQIVDKILLSVGKYLASRQAA